MTYTEKELDQFLHGISLSLLSKKSAQHWRYDEETAKEIEWLEVLERKVRADKADRKTESNSEKPNNSTISKMEQVEEPKTQMKTQNSNLTFEKDECAKEYEELGLKELKELIEADRKTEPLDKDINVRSKDEPQVIMPKKCKGCDSASKIIEAYSRGFEDGAEAVKAVKVKALHKDYIEPYVTIEDEPQERNE